MKMKLPVLRLAMLAGLYAGFFLISKAQPRSGYSDYWVYLNLAEAGISVQEAKLQLKNQGFAVGYASKWLQAIAVSASAQEVQLLTSMSTVKEVAPVAGYLVPARMSAPPNYMDALLSLNPAALAEAGLNGKGIAIGVIDAGFYQADKNPYLETLFQQQQIVEARDFLKPQNAEIFSKQESYLDGHGTEVLKMIAGKYKDHQLGLATHATFYLARTDHGKFENRMEEQHWIAAIEWLDSLGVKLVNTSLGYTKGFDDPKENYSPKEIDGKTSAIARAAQIATEEKGMLIIVSAGNEGNDHNWKIISTPADAPGVLAVGATGKNHLKAGYSSIGPAELPFLKPEVACYSSRGTSFSAPVITGLAACLWQAFPEATNQEIRNAIIRSSSLYPAGNNYVGYGIPDAAKALKILAKERVSTTLQEIKTRKEEYSLSGLEAHAGAVIFHKSDRRNVIEQQSDTTSSDGRLHLKRKSKDIHYSTVKVGEKVFEIIWK